ncbi:MAG TPA: oligopeptide/dipeptide ABC transporter ATP-binding protein [Gaiellaceae bacterium]|jgi:oligopeptide/dipeptide ABC transporter ATP-binding protein
MTVDESPYALEVRNLVKEYRVGGGIAGGGSIVHAVDDVSFVLQHGELLGLVGESGSGKSTVANCVMRLTEPTGGEIRLRGVDITHLSRRAMRPLRRELHMVFQDPYSSLNPHMSCGDIVGEPLRLHRITKGRELRMRVDRIFDAVGLRTELRYRYPHELSGGQRQRVGLARALILEPSVLIADEPVSALDVSVQASILNLLRDLQRDMGFSCLFITHDLGTVEFLCDRVAVMYLGKLVELAPRAELFRNPQHPYTQALLSAAVVPDPDAQRRRQRTVLEGDVPSPLDPPSGCRFRTRCPLEPRSAPRSTEEEPPLVEFARDHLVACHLVAPNRPAPRLVSENMKVATGP